MSITMISIKYYCYLLIICSILSNFLYAIDINDDVLAKKLNESLKITQSILNDISKRWDIIKYPLFLKSVAMPPTSWEVLKIKFMNRILNSYSSKFQNSQDFIISFTGSSVTAGHDSHFNLSYPVLVGKRMENAFKPFNINLISRNAAMGNNPW